MDARDRVPTASSHVDLLAAAATLRSAVVDDDLDRVHAELTRLRTAVARHVREEHGTLEASPELLRDVALDGQRRLLDLLDEVVLGLETEECTCLVRAAEIELALRRQVRLEEVALFREAPRDG